MINKTQTRMYFLRKLRSFDLNPLILYSFYCSAVHSVLTFGAICWGGNIQDQDKNRIDKIIRKAGNVIGRQLTNFDNFCNERTVEKMKRIANDSTHPLHEEFTPMTSGSGRYRQPGKGRISARFTKSFVPRAVHLFNENHTRRYIEREEGLFNF